MSRNHSSKPMSLRGGLDSGARLLSNPMVIMEKLFSYGTLQQEEVQLATFKRKLSGQKAAIVGYKCSLIEIADPAVVAKSGKTHHPIVSRSNSLDDRVDGTVFLVTPQELAEADAYEVSDYERVLAELLDGGRAWVYVARNTAKA